MIYTEMVNKALRVAYEAHAGQFDKGGIPYILHPVHLAEQMPDEDSTVCALLHDVVEDSITQADLIELGFPDSVLEAVRLLTHLPGVPYMEYVAAIAENSIARRVKLADLSHNMDESRFAGFENPPSDEQLAARREKYGKAFALLTAGK